MKKVTCVAVLCMVMVVLLGEVEVTKAVTCSPLELIPCLGAIMSPQSPTNSCCVKLREQIPCLCGYLKDPNLKQYVSSPNAKRVAKTCGVPAPSC